MNEKTIEEVRDEVYKVLSELNNQISFKDRDYQIKELQKETKDVDYMEI